MEKHAKLEVWMRGPIASIPSVLQPVAHTLLQIQEDIQSVLERVSEQQLWERPTEVASIAFHVQHIIGVVDRMFTYARGSALSDAQFAYLKAEGNQTDGINKDYLLRELRNGMEKALAELRSTDIQLLGETRHLGRQKIPTTLIGLLFHAAEHSQRHFGQLLVMEKWLNT